MPAQSNGRAKKPKKSTPNGQMNGHMNGHIDKSKSSTSVTRSPRSTKPGKTILGRLTSAVSRLLVWYLLITLSVRCPSSITKLSDASPKVCKPYLQARSYAAPYLDPYYQAYVAPQVEKVQPYIDRFDAQVYAPVSAFTKDKYATYGAHRVESAQNYVEAEWDKTIRPQLDNAQTQAKKQYGSYLAPHVQQASDAAAPYYERAKASTVEIYHLTLLPTYEALLPYSRQAYKSGNHALVHVVFPNVRAARDVTWAFLSRNVWPQVRILYGDNVEPQLVRIRERLGRHRDQQKIESVVDALPSETPISQEQVQDETTASIPTESAKASASGAGWGFLDDLWPAESSSTTSSQTIKPQPTEAQPAEPQLTGAELREKLNQDLREWQTKFAVAADKGSEDLEQRVAEITERQIENGVKGHGAALVVQLEETADATVAKFKRLIKQTVEALPEEATEADLESAYEKCVAKTRELGLSVKEKAQAIRTWKASYESETDHLVQAAVRSTVEVLERIHGLGLQEVGMRWAWTEGVTYKDWQNYHKLRNTLNEWQAEVEAVGSRHEGLKTAHEEARSLEDAAMATASKMVNELVRLKEVSRWKIWAGDSSDDFSEKEVPARIYNAAKGVASDLQDAASSASSKVSEAAVGSETPATESATSAAKDKVSEASSKASEIVNPDTKSAAAGVKAKVSQVSSDISDSAVGTGTDIKSNASGGAQSIKSGADDTKEEAKEEAKSFARVEPKQQKVMGGAMAQVIAEAREIVFDDVIDDDDSESYSQKLQDAVAGAGDRAADLSRAVSEALLGPSKTQGTVESATSLASEQYAKALAAASSVLYGTQQGTVESATSVASDKFAQAVTAASYAIYGTPTPTAIYRTVQVQANSRYEQGISLANEQYSNAKSQLSELVSGKPKPAHETMFSMIEQAYSDSVGAASDRLQAALQYTDSVKSYAAGPTQGYFESVSSIAASKLSEGLSAASAQFTSQPTPALEGARRQYYEALGLAHARYSEFLGSASSAVYGPEQGTIESIASVASESAASVASQVSSSVIGSETPWAQSVASDVSGSAQLAASKASAAAESLASQVSSGVIGSETPWTESVASQASQNWEALIAKASSQVYGEPTPWHQSVYSQAGAYGAQATAQAAGQYAAMSALISELVVGKEPDFTESVMNRFASAYHTGIPAAISSVNSYASENYEAASSYASENIEAAGSIAGETYEAATSYAADAYASASSVVSSVFTPPPAIESVLSQANEQLNAAVESASVAVYGTTKGTVEQASESVASAYSSVQSKASEAIYGTQQAQNSFAAVAASAQAAISEAVFGPPSPTGYAASVTGGAQSAYSSISSVAGEKAADAASAISSAIYGPEQGAVDSASSRLAAAVDAANSRISEIYAEAAKTAGNAASSVSSVVTEATQKVRDEL
ncbi:hypothetical protein K491DRAFT_711832 [Lophiostoma macrostomum CBS 122681]|uniref:Transcription factor hoxa13 n=1 Tax=Lophiostoma macrostomum CBS 122681 TaxID=1314788 RepID=A0A6A6TKR2_9PLEO|nr:hypothetical protein K491DRAFT_711832 [Lophiostoma macrostomum CBS 122681]